MKPGMARDCTEGRFREVLERFGGPQQVLLVGELWDRAESRALLQNFLQEVFPAELVHGGQIFNKEPPLQETPKHGTAHKGAPRERRPHTATNRTIRFGLVFFLCRPGSVVLPASQRQMREILRDVRKRLPAGGAVVGVIMGASSEETPAGVQAAVCTLLDLLRSVFPPNNKGARCSEVRAAALIPGREESRREVQMAACEALSAADEQRTEKPNMKSRCFSWRRWRQEDTAQKENLPEGTALTVLSYPNGDCGETTAEA
ncbi:uncharacterized protein C2orf72 homolog [Anomaloglossus baeobatrachus]|uniref:uncharacterized protein C2orf72 homolog n=1 Tax=Anomaloglossus baeobatrachus TaxID=238106 RepID=UPI003F4F7CA4